MKKSGFVRFLAIFTFCFLSGCATLSRQECPYVVGNIESLCGTGTVSNSTSDPSSESEDFYFSAVRFTFYNGDKKTVSEISVSFRLYDSNGENPFIGTNCVNATSSEIIGANSTSEIIVSLDDFISVVPEEPYLVDYFYVKKIVYTDGSEWRDDYGIYSL